MKASVSDIASFNKINTDLVTLRNDVHYNAVRVQRYGKMRFAIWKTRIAIHIAIHLVSLVLSITAPSSVLLYNSRVMKLASITQSYFQQLLVSLVCFSRRNN